MDDTQGDVLWKVGFSSKAEKQAGKLPAEIRARLFALKLDIERKGEVRIVEIQYAGPHGSVNYSLFK